MTDERRDWVKSNLSQVENVLPAVLSKLGLERRMKEHALMQVWSALLPGPLAQRCRPLFIDHQHNLVIAVSDASVAQELSLMKAKLVRELSQTAKSLGIGINSLRMDMKNFHRLEEHAAVPEPPLPKPAEKDLDELSLSNDDMQLISDLTQKLRQADDERDELNVMVLRTFEKQLRLTEWRRRHGYPICDACRNPVTRLLSRGAHKVCFNCSVAE